MIEDKKPSLPVTLPGDERRLPVVAEPPAVCRKLRSKTAFGSMQPGAPDWRHGDSTTAVYWCLDTMETAGSDDQLAHPHLCRESRGCYLPRDA